MPAIANTRAAKTLVPAVGLLALSVVINYVDRSNLSVAAPMLKDELGLSAAQLGMLLSSFFWTYTAFQVVSGWLVDRFNANWVIAVGFLIWSLATAATGVARGFAMLLAMRLVLGVGESVAFPSYSKILAKHLPEAQRGSANALVSAGIPAGAALGTYFGATLMARFGWRWFFVAFGLLSLFWLLLWAIWRPQGPGLPVTREARVPSFEEILVQRSAWGTFGGLFAYNYHSYFLITWLPWYLVHERNFSTEQMGRIGGAVFLTLALSALVCGWISDRWIGGGGSPTRVRKTFTALGLAISSFSCISIVTVGFNSRIIVMFLFLTCIGAGFCTSNLWAITQTLAGPLGAGRWTGLQNFAGNFAGIISPWLTGLVVERTGHFFWAFAATSAVLLCGTLSWAFVVGPVESVRWKLQTLSSTVDESGA